MPRCWSECRAVLLGGTVLLVASTSARAQDFERIAPEQPAVPPPMQSLPAPSAAPPLPQGARVLVPSLTGLAFVDNASSVRPGGLAPSGGVRVDAGSLLDDDAFRKAMAPFLGRPVTLDLLNDIARLTVLFFRERDRPLVDVIVPEQDISSGTIQFIAMEFVVGRVTAEGNEWFSDDVLVSGLRAAPGKPVRGSILLDDINRLNENSFRHTDLVYQRGGRPGETDIVLRTEDRLPLRVYAGVDNTGSESSSRNRVFTGFNWGNAFGLDHRLSYQRTTSPDAALRFGRGEYMAHAITYQIPLPWRDTLTLFGSYSESRPTLDDPFHQTERSGQASIRYTIRLPRWESLTGGVDLGFDFKRTAGNLDFGTAAASHTMTDVLQWMVGYSGNRPDTLGRTTLSANLFLSPGGLTDYNTSRAFRPSDTATGRANADARYAYLRVVAERSFILPEDFTWTTRVTGQLSSANLLSSEQLGAGGAESVRGYNEREVNGDQGIILTSELSTPGISPAALLGIAEGTDQLRLIAFVDYGRVSERRPAAGEKGVWDLASVGAGFRYALGGHLSARLDVAHAMPRTDPSENTDNRVHFGLTLAY